MSRPTLLYLHGFASGPSSRKGMAFEAALGPAGIRVVRLDLRLPNRDELRLSAMVDHVMVALREHRACAIMGSSLGGLVAAIVTSAVPTLAAAILLAPAVGFASRWSTRLGEAAMTRWRAGERLVLEDHAGGPPLRVDFGFYEDAVAIETAWVQARARGPACTVPTLVVQGLRDEVLDPAAARAFTRELPRATLVELDDGHELLATLPITLATVSEFLTAQGIGAGRAGV